MEISGHKLVGDNVKPFEQTKKVSGKFAPGALDTIIVHYTASPSFRSAYNSLMNPRIKASAHILLDRDGTVLQMADFETIAWHAGRSSYKDRSGFNKYSIGIEIVNAGPLKLKNGEYFDVYNIKKPADQVMEGKHRNRPIVSKYWHKYTEEQIKITEEICRLLVDKYGIKYILGHEEISVGRKFDPGPAFPLDEMRERIFNNEFGHAGEKPTITELKTGDIAFVSASSLNIRAAASARADKIADALPEGTKVDVIAVEGDWAKVEVEVNGWVLSTHIELDNTDDNHDAIVSSLSTNVHSIPMEDSSDVSEALVQGDPLQIIQRFEGWYHVSYPIQGFVAKKYLDQFQAKG
ncbi:MAG: N-acetylmuramoyl-L-alanine amidase [Flammeovirgaceae bacterium]